MSLIDKFKALPTPMIILHIASKAIVGLGLGILLQPYLKSFGWWILGLGVILSIPPIARILSSK